MSWENKNLRCFNCRFWQPGTEVAGGEVSRQRSIYGQCRRLAPPTLVVDLPDHGKRYPAWATTKRDDWCGDHSHREM